MSFKPTRKPNDSMDSKVNVGDDGEEGEEDDERGVDGFGAGGNVVVAEIGVSNKSIKSLRYVWKNARQASASGTEEDLVDP